MLATHCALLLSACSGHDLPDARIAFYQGNYGLAKEEIGSDEIDGVDSVLVLMERGTIYQTEGEYEKSSMDYIRAGDILKELQTYSLSEGASSWVVNDTLYSFEGAPFEQTMLHSFTALNHLAMGNWEDGGVEARRIIYSLRPEERGEDYPDDAFSRYLAAFILEMTGDRANAEVQYQLADELLPELSIDNRGGIGYRSPAINAAGESGAGLHKEAVSEYELVCFFLLGRSPTMRELRGQYSHSFFPPQIQIYTGNRHLGDARILTNINSLAMTTWNLEAPARIAKTAARIAAKEVLASAVDEQDAALGALTRIILIGMMERPDFRRWETLPRWLAVARLSCPADLTSFDVKLQGGGSGSATVLHVQKPLLRRGKVFFSFVRDLPGFNGVGLREESDQSPAKAISLPSEGIEE